MFAYPVDIFNNWTIFLIEGELEEKIIYEKYEPRSFNAVKLQKREFDTVAMQAYKYMGNLYDASAKGAD